MIVAHMQVCCISIRRIAAMLAAVWFIALGSGAAMYVHELDHARQDALQDAADRAAGIPVSQHEHDDSNCEVHAQLHMALLAPAWVPILIFLGLFVAYLTLLNHPLIGRLAPVRIDCRGPPLARSQL